MAARGGARGFASVIALVFVSGVAAAATTANASGADGARPSVLGLTGSRSVAAGPAVRAAPPPRPRPPRPALSSPRGARRPKPAIRRRAASSPASTTAGAPGWEIRRGTAALSRISYPWPQVGYSVEFLPGVSGYRGRTFPDTHRIEIYVRPGDSVELLAHVVAHELGHAVDLTYNTDARRQEWLQLRGVDPNRVSWFTCGGCRDFATPAGDYAETFALWQAGGGLFFGTLAPPPTPEQLARLVVLFGGAG